jgi:sulfate permease, SulP family
LNEVLLKPETLSTLILDLYPVNRIDSSALHALSDLHRNLKEKQIQLLFSGVKGPVMDAMKRSGFADQVGSDHFYNRIFEASESSKGVQNAYLEAPAS